MEATDESRRQRELKQVRGLVAVVIFGLVVSGLTAFPLLRELNLLASLVTAPDGISPRFPFLPGLTEWVLRVRDGLAVTYRDYPFIAYGTDWLAFGHLVIATFFVLPFRDPLRYRGVLKVGVLACLGVIPLALVCGPLRGIPFSWQLIDCSFGVLCLPPLFWALRRTREERAGLSSGEHPG